MPEVPTVAEQGFPGFDVTAWYGLFARAGTPPEVVARLHHDVVAALRHFVQNCLGARFDFGVEQTGVGGDFPQLGGKVLIGVADNFHGTQARPARPLAKVISTATATAKSHSVLNAPGG